jgi:putative phosphoribosyl transferase
MIRLAPYPIAEAIDLDQCAIPQGVVEKTMKGGSMILGRTISVRLPPHSREGLLGLPPGEAKGIVLFAHGSGSSRLSPRNTSVAKSLQRAGLATLLFDLLTDIEAADRRNVFDIVLLAERLNSAARWVSAYPAAEGLALGFFGASTGAAAALVAASQRHNVRAIVSRGGRPDLAGDALARVTAPTLLIVGGADPEVLELNRQALRDLRCEAKLQVVQGATHLFEEPGALEAVVALARDWFLRHLRPIEPTN